MLDDGPTEAPATQRFEMLISERYVARPSCSIVNRKANASVELARRTLSCTGAEYPGERSAKNRSNNPSRAIVFVFVFFLSWRRSARIRGSVVVGRFRQKHDEVEVDVPFGRVTSI